MNKQLDILVTKLNSNNLNELEQLVKETSYILEELLVKDLEQNNKHDKKQDLEKLARGGFESTRRFDNRMLQARCSSLVSKLQHSKVELINIIRDITKIAQDHK